MKNRDFKQWFRAAAVRAIKTVAQTSVSSRTGGIM